MAVCDNLGIQQLNTFWSMLDNMSVKDPEEYRNFIERQLKEGADFYSPPQPYICIYTNVLGPKKGMIYINICSWKRVPTQASQSDPVPVCGGRLETITEQKEFSVVDVAFNPELLKMIEKDKQEREIHLLVLTFIQQQYNLDLSQSYKLAKDKIKGNIQDMKDRLMRPNQIKSSTSDSSDPAPSLLQQISSLRLAESREDSSIKLTTEREKKPSKPGLIEVISSTESAQNEPRKPEHHLKVCDDVSGSGKSLQLNVKLPGLKSVSQCQLSISQDSIHLEVEDIYYLHLPLPEPVKEETCTAVFNKKKQILTVTVTML